MSIAGNEIAFECLLTETEDYFLKGGASIRSLGPEETASVKKCGEAIFITGAITKEWRNEFGLFTPFSEYSLLCIPISQRLMSKDACLFHAAAFRWRDRAFLIAGPSGVGKSTRLKALMETHPDEISVINGDKPALLTREDGSVLVCPSPWNGKEGWHGAMEAPLGGIFILQRGEEDAVRPAKNTEKAAILFLSIFQTWESEESLKAAGSIADKIGRSAPVWHLTGHDIGQSAELIYDQLQKEAERLGL